MVGLAEPGLDIVVGFLAGSGDTEGLIYLPAYIKPKPEKTSVFREVIIMHGLTLELPPDQLILQCIRRGIFIVETDLGVRPPPGADAHVGRRKNG
jgi:hypothetical protein